jgi:sugar/nucleoside kinase (ribokinase family)
MTVVGSISFDSIKTPLWERVRVLGGAAIHFALSARFFGEVHVVGAVGDDFSIDDFAVLERHGVDTLDIERVVGEKTFSWRVQYGSDLNSRETLKTELGAFETFKPKLSEASRAAQVLHLGNIAPELQGEVQAQCSAARFVGLDSMNLWIDVAREALIEVISEVDCVLLSDDELRQLTDAPTIRRAARQIHDWGPRIVVAKQGENGAALITRDDFFAVPAYREKTVVDPTGAGDSFAGGFLGYISSHPDLDIDESLLRRAMVYGTVLASFTVQEFGVERILRLTNEDIEQRVQHFERASHGGSRSWPRPGDDANSLLCVSDANDRAAKR